MSNRSVARHARGPCQGEANHWGGDHWRTALAADDALDEAAQPATATATAKVKATTTGAAGSSAANGGATGDASTKGGASGLLSSTSISCIASKP